MAEDLLLSHLRSKDLMILEKMKSTGSDKDAYYKLLEERFALYSEYEKKADALNNNEQMYIISNMKQNVFMQVQMSKMEQEIENIKSRLDNLETTP